MSDYNRAKFKLEAAGHTSFSQELTVHECQAILAELDRLNARIAELEAIGTDYVRVMAERDHHRFRAGALTAKLDRRDARIAELEAKLARWESLEETRLMLLGRKDADAP